MIDSAGVTRVAMLFATSGHSGVDRVISNLLPILGRYQYQFDLLTIHGHGPDPENVPSNVRLHRLPARHRNTVLLPLIRYFRTSRPSVVLTASHRLNRAALLARILARSRSRVVIRMGMTVSGLADVVGERAQRRLLRSMRRWYPRADAVVVPSRGVGDDLIRLASVDAGRLFVINNPIVTEKFHALAAEPVEHPWVGDREAPLVLGVGSLEARKDFATLIRAFSHVRAQRRCRLMILGEGRERDSLLKLAGELGIAEDLALPGFVANPYAYMARAAVFVLSSKREGSSAVLAESLACGTPAVATDCPSGPAEILDGGRVGPLVPVGDVRGLAAAIGNTLDDPPAREQLRAAAEPFRADVSARRYLAALGLEEGVRA